MQSNTETTPLDPGGLARLETALRSVLGPTLDEEVRVAVEDQPWYSPDLPFEEVFRLWIYDNVEHPLDPQWVLQVLRANERKHLCRNLGIPDSAIAGKSPRQLSAAVLEATGIPSHAVSGVRSVALGWRRLLDLLNNGEEERAAVLARQRAERLLKTILYFFSTVAYMHVLREILRAPENLRVPRALAGLLGGVDPMLGNALIEDGVGDLGFFALALRKLSARLETMHATHLSGRRLLLFTNKEYEAFAGLGVALQAYHHDRPMRTATRKSDLGASLDSVGDSIDSMIDRKVIPDVMLVIETACVTLLGHSFRGICEDGAIRPLTATTMPTLGRHIWFVASTTRNYAMAHWTPVPWAAEHS